MYDPNADGLIFTYFVATVLFFFVLIVVLALTGVI